MNPLDFVKYLPLILRFVEMAPRITSMMRNGTPIIDVLAQNAPDVLALVKAFGKQEFPAITAEWGQVSAGAQALFDHDTVQQAQNALNRLGLAPQPLILDGMLGEKTKAAVKVAQQKYGLDVDGWPGPRTMGVLKNEMAKLSLGTPAPSGPSQ